MNHKFLLFLTPVFLAGACDLKKTVDNEVKTGKAAVSEEKMPDLGHVGHDHYYTCSMHPNVRESEPGKCPICNMNLTKVVLENDEPETTQAKDHTEAPGVSIAKVKLKKSQMEHFKPGVFSVSSMKMSKKVRLLGSVMQSEEKESTVPARVSGRVEKVFVRSMGSFIQKGDPVVQFYSPKLISAGQEYIVSRKSYEESKQDDFKDLMNQAGERLESWGIKRFQYESWYKKNKVPDRIVIYSPATGIVRKHNATVGRYLKEGQNIFELSDLSEVWVEMDVYEHDSAIVKLGQELNLKFSASPSTNVKSEVDFIAPILDSRSRTLKIRATIPNPKGVLKPGMIAEASLNVIFDGEPLVVPRTAIINTGKRKVAWRRLSEQKFQAQVVETGHESEGFVEILKGLEEGDQVVMDGNFLLDAQAQLFGGYSDMTSDAPSHNHQ